MKSSRRNLVAFPLVMAGLLAVLSFSSLAWDGLKPEVSKGKGEQCVEDTDFMRRNHMEMLKHQRDETMHNGIRTKKYSLNECISCHVQPDEKGEVATIDSPEHFCASCHNYAAVNIDCFNCHADRPAADQTAYRHKMKPGVPHHMANLDDSSVAADALNLTNTEGK